MSDHFSVEIEQPFGKVKRINSEHFSLQVYHDNYYLTMSNDKRNVSLELVFLFLKTILDNIQELSETETSVNKKKCLEKVTEDYSNLLDLFPTYLFDENLSHFLNFFSIEYYWSEEKNIEIVPQWNASLSSSLEVVQDYVRQIRVNESTTILVKDQDSCDVVTIDEMTIYYYSC